jgi:hypothetical protein
MGLRSELRLGRLALVLLVSAAVVFSIAGCQSIAFTVAYLFTGLDEPAECNKLKEKRVVVVCRQVASLQYVNGRVDQELAEQVAALLKKNVSKITVVEPRKVNEWMDENETGEGFTEVGKAFKADMVVGIELERFSLLDNQSLYQGRASATVKLHDCKTGEVMFRKSRQTVYPPHFPIQTSEMPERVFRERFIQVMAEQLGRYFFAHDPHEDIGLGTEALN